MSAAASARPEPKYTAAEWEQKSWEENNKKQLRKWRNLEIAAGVPHNRYEATPRACWLVEQAHSTNQQKVFMALKAAEKFERPESRCLTRISSITINGDPLHRLVHISLGTLSWLIKQMFGTAMPISTLRRCLKRLAEKHSIIIHQVIRRGDDKVSNREASIFELPLYSAVLSARANDPKIGTTHRSDEKPNGFQHTDGRSNSMNLLSPEKVRGWKIEQLVKVGKVETASKGEAQSKSNSAPPQSRGPVGPPLEPAPEARPSEVAVSSVQQPTKAVSTKAVVKTPSKVAAVNIDQMLATVVTYWGTDGHSYTQTAKKWLDHFARGYCAPTDAAEIAANAIAVAAARNPPREMTAEGLVICCRWIIDRGGADLNKATRTLVSRVRLPVPYLLTSTAEDVTIGAYFSWRDEEAIKQQEKAVKDAARAHEDLVEVLRIYKRTLEHVGRFDKQVYDYLKAGMVELAKDDKLWKEIDALKEPTE